MSETQKTSNTDIFICAICKTSGNHVNIIPVGVLGLEPQRLCDSCMREAVKISFTQRIEVLDAGTFLALCRKMFDSPEADYNELAVLILNLFENSIAAMNALMKISAAMNALSETLK